ncbi:MAG TPA: MmgE/PrpD family protein [Xanthobacteraceae bacterium]|nr:MmgE/PrpD family protein [Xanthobacteraceae bacterium]
MNAPLMRTTDGLTQRLADFTSSFSLHQAPANVLRNAKIAILDCLGVSVLAARQEIGTALKNFAHEHSRPGPCTIWGTDITTDARDAALINGTLAHGLDFDDRNHSSTYSLAAPLAIAEAGDLSGKKVLEGFIVGREVRNSLDGIFAHRGSGIGPGAKGWHSNGILGPIASACAVAKTLDLDADSTRLAVGLATASSGALTRDGGTMAKPFRTGHAASTGVTCVLLARSGFSSDDTALEGRYGLLEAIGPLSPEIVASLAVNLGKTFNLEAPIRVKPFASCSASHGGIEAMLRLCARHPFTAKDVESIHCDLKPYPLVRDWPARGVEGRFSMRFCLAMALTNGSISPDDFTDENVNDPGIQRLMQRTYHDTSKSLVVQLRNGRKLEQPIERPTNLVDREAIEKKFHDCVARTLSSQQASAAAKLVNELEEITSIRDLTRNLRHARY